MRYPLCALWEWMGFEPKNQKPRRIKKWQAWMARSIGEYQHDHDWRKRRNPPEGERSFDLICAKCRAITYTINPE